MNKILKHAGIPGAKKFDAEMLKGVRRPSPHLASLPLLAFEL